MFRKEGNEDVILPFKIGFEAKFVSGDTITSGLVKVYLNQSESVQIELDEELRNKDVNAALQGLVGALTESFVNGYLSALGLRDESIFRPNNENTKSPR